MPKQRGALSAVYLPFIRRHSRKALARSPCRNALDRSPSRNVAHNLDRNAPLPVVAILTTWGRIVALFKNRAAPIAELRSISP